MGTWVSGGHLVEGFGLEQGHGSALDGDELVAPELVEEAGDGFARGAGHVGDFLVGKGHGELEFGFAEGGGATPLEEEVSEPAGSGAGECEPFGVVEDGHVFRGEGLSRVHAGHAMLVEEVHELFLAHGFDVARLDGFGGDFVRNVGEDSVEAEQIAGAGNLEDHGLAFPGSGRDLCLSATQNKDVTSGVAFREKLGAAGMAHENTDRVEVPEGFGRQVAEHTQVAVFAIDAVFGHVMVVCSKHQTFIT